MRAPRRKRPLRRHVDGPGTMKVDVSEIAGRVSYVGSPEHKDIASFAEEPRPRADASICPRHLSQDQELVTRWLRTAVERGAIGGMKEGDFPRYAWHKEEGIVYEARLENKVLGEYKGYPLNESEWPGGLESIYG